jgi:hypothetical protein
VAGDAEGEGLAGPGPPHDQGDPLTALAVVPDHGLLIGAGGGMGGQGLAHRLMGGDGGLFARPAGGAGDQPLLDGEEVGGVDQRRSSRARSATTLTARSARNRSASSSSSVRVAPARPAPRANRMSGRVKVDAAAVNPSGPASQQPTGRILGQRLVLAAVGCPAGHLPDQGVRVHPALGRVLTPASIQGVRALVLFGLPSRLDGPLDQPRRPLPTIGA